MNLDHEKKLAGEAAAELVEDGMTVGLGTGSTAAYAVRRLGERVRAGLHVRGLPTSTHTEALAREVGIPLVDFAEVTRLDLTLDGADEIDPDLNLIKGGGGALFREKIVAAASRRLIIFADHTKLVPQLGAFPLPVEVNPFGWQVAAERIAALGAHVTLRQSGEGPFVSDNHGYILDCFFGKIDDPVALERHLAAVTGVMESGLFVRMAERALLGDGQAVRTIQPAP
ncbi:MAG: ribose-5-phosphate isomerase RpiA [Candidatus Lambdaproteobacteria bacterium]|nr:ribose-5-phosphate isomerase RpiA [Candidatus Lambdaproteobacteria bacterium]